MERRKRGLRLRANRTSTFGGPLIILEQRQLLDPVGVQISPQRRGATALPQAICREQIKLAGLGDTSCGRSFTLRPPEERCSTKVQHKR